MSKKLFPKNQLKIPGPGKRLLGFMNFMVRMNFMPLYGEIVCGAQKPMGGKNIWKKLLKADKMKKSNICYCENPINLEKNIQLKTTCYVCDRKICKKCSEILFDYKRSKRWVRVCKKCKEKEPSRWDIKTRRINKCRYCESSADIRIINDFIYITEYAVECLNLKCLARGPSRKNEDSAVKAWNEERNKMIKIVDENKKCIATFKHEEDAKAFLAGKTVVEANKIPKRWRKIEIDPLPEENYNVMNKIK